MGQANYSAGNAFMDSLMNWRRSHNLPGQSINIGIVLDASGLGDVAESPEQRRRRYSHLDGTEITTHELQTLLRVVLRGDIPMPAQIIAGMNDKLPREGGASWQLDRKFDHRIRLRVGDQGRSSIQTSALLKKADSIENATKIVNEALREYLANAMTANVDEIDAELPLSALGGMSALNWAVYPNDTNEFQRATEVQNWVSREMRAELSSFEFLGSQPVKVLAEKVAMKSSFVNI